MRVQLPSYGVLGFNSVELDVPRFSHLRNIAFDSLTEEETRTALIEQMVKEKDRVEKLTLWDRDYLFKIIVSAMHMNRIALTVTCPHCNSSSSAEYVITRYEAVELSKSIPLSVEKKVGDVTYTYKIPQIEDERKIIEYAKNQANYSSAYDDALVAAILGYSIDAEGVEQAVELPMSVYYSATIFHQITFHGLNNYFPFTCPKCGKEHMVIVAFDKAMFDFDASGIIRKYQDVAGIVDFKSFLDLSIPEFDLLKNTK